MVADRPHAPAHRRPSGQWSERRRRRARRSALVVAGVVIVAVVGSLVLWGRSGARTTPPVVGSPRSTRPVTSPTRGGHQRPLADYLGAEGVVAPAIVAENRRPGTTSWEIGSNQASTSVVGFAGTTYAADGATVALYVSSTAPSFHVVAYRMGWYDGDGARRIWSSGQVPGHVQPACPVQAGTNMVSCANWTASLHMAVTAAFVPGEYLLLLVGSGGQESYIPLTIWDPASHATYLVMSRPMTEEGWNTYGGYDFYQGEGACILDDDGYPPCNRARVVSFDRPYTAGDGSSDFLTNEYPLVQYMERNGLDVTYCTDVTVNDHPGMLLAHRALLSLGHDETWTYPELAGALHALSKGVNIAFMSAAAIVRHARLQASPIGPDREVVDYRNSAEDPLDGHASGWEVTGNTWESPPTDWSATSLTGELYSGYLEPGTGSVPFVVYDAAAWIFRGTGLHDGSAIPGVIESDIDHLDPGGPMPDDVEVLGHSPVPLTVAYTNQGEWNGVTYSDMTYYTDPQSHAGVFDSGTVSWIFSLRPCVPAVPVCRGTLVGVMTGNLLRLFGRGPAGDFVPSVANWRQVTPAGS